MFYVVSVKMSEQEVHSSVAQRIIIKFLVNEQSKSIEIFSRLKAQFGEKQGQTINAAYYSSLLTEKVKPAYKSKRRTKSIRGIRLLHDNARPHTAILTRNTLEKLHWDVLPHPPYSPDLSPCDFHVFGPLKEALGGQRFRTNDEVQQFVQSWLRTQPEEFYYKGIMKLPERWKRCIELEGEYVEH